VIWRLFSRTVAIAVLAYLLGYALFAVTLPRPAGSDRTDGIVVLTGGIGRIDRGFALMEEGRARRMLISGVARTVRPTELAAAYDVDPDLLSCCVDLGREAFDTRSNADEVVRWIERRRIASIRLVTNDVHMPRALFELKKRIGDRATILADAVPTRPSFRQIFLEYNKFVLGHAADLIGI
jgi:uncharacterized SAM-binding protein YcdF (DUF218 family)